MYRRRNLGRWYVGYIQWRKRRQAIFPFCNLCPASLHTGYGKSAFGEPGRADDSVTVEKFLLLNVSLPESL